MSLLSRISARAFAGAAYTVLAFAGWKKRTVEANLRHVSQGVWGREDVGLQPRKIYRQMLKNLTLHVGDILFGFGAYKNLPFDVSQYPHNADGCIYDISMDSRAVIEKMRGGGIFLTAHYGNYEASGAWLCALGVPLKASFIPLKPEWLNRFVYEKVRCVNGRPYSINARTPREFLSQLDGKSADCNGHKQLFCLLADQDSRISSAMDGNFLGRDVKINPLPDFLLKHRQGTPVFFCWIEEREGCKILRACEASGSNINDSYRRWLEERIRENPALWYGWTHRRFLSKNPEIYLNS